MPGADKDMMADQFPSSTSILIFPSAAQGFSTTLKSLRRSTLSIPSRLASIQDDSLFVQRTAAAYDLPLVANERCGSWYIPTEKKIGSAYFKSTDGHMGQWSFSLRRLNLQVLSLIGEHGGCMIVDSTRRGKSIPDALAKTIPVWAAVFNRVLFPNAKSLHALQFFPTVVSLSEAAQIEKLLNEFSRNLKSLNLDFEELRAKLRKPMQLSWITRDGDSLQPGPRRQDCHLVLLCSASRRVTGAEMSEGGYIQGAGDDSEAWSLGLTPDLFWKNQDLLFQTGEEDLGELIGSLIMKSKKTSLAIEPVLIKPAKNLYLCQSTNHSSHSFDIVIDCSAPQHCPDEKRKILSLQCPEGKLGSRDLRNKLFKVRTFLDANKDAIETRKLLIICSTGRDLSVGVALAVLCMLYDNCGSFLATQSQSDFNKQLVRERLAWITSAKPDANPSRSTLQAVNTFLMERP